MEHITLYLKKNTPLFQQHEFKEEIARILTSHIIQNVTSDMLHIARNTITLRASSSMKNTLFMKKEQILKELQEQNRKNNFFVRDIR